MSQSLINNLKIKSESLEQELAEYMKRISSSRPKTGDQNGEVLIDFLESKLEQIETNF